MAKKQPVVINKEPLSVTELGNVSTKKGNLTFLIIIFIIFLGGFLAYPYVSPYIDDIISGKSPLENQNNEPEPESEVEKQSESEEKTKTEKKNTTQSLVCKKQDENITYYGNDNGLYRISHVITINTNSESFVDDYLANEDLVAKYQGNEGYTASSKTEGDSIIYSYKIDLKKADLSLSGSNYYFEAKTELTTIKEELVKLGFSCSGV